MVHANARLTQAVRLILVQPITADRPAAHVAAEIGVSRTTAYRWLPATASKASLASKTGQAAPTPNPNQTPPTVVHAILTSRSHCVAPASSAPPASPPSSVL